jgi:hypothetical protein
MTGMVHLRPSKCGEIQPVKWIDRESQNFSPSLESTMFSLKRNRMLQILALQLTVYHFVVMVRTLRMRPQPCHPSAVGQNVSKQGLHLDGVSEPRKAHPCPVGSHPWTSWSSDGHPQIIIINFLTFKWQNNPKIKFRPTVPSWHQHFLRRQLVNIESTWIWRSTPGPGLLDRESGQLHRRQIHGINRNGVTFQRVGNDFQFLHVHASVLKQK